MITCESRQSRCPFVCDFGHRRDGHWVAAAAGPVTQRCVTVCNRYELFSLCACSLYIYICGGSTFSKANKALHAFPCRFLYVIRLIPGLYSVSLAPTRAFLRTDEILSYTINSVAHSLTLPRCLSYSHRRLLLIFWLARIVPLFCFSVFSLISSFSLINTYIYIYIILGLRFWDPCVEFPSTKSPEDFVCLDLVYWTLTLGERERKWAGAKRIENGQHWFFPRSTFFFFKRVQQPTLYFHPSIVS